MFDSLLKNTGASIYSDFYAHLDQVLAIVDGQMVGHWEEYLISIVYFKIHKNQIRFTKHFKIYEKT